MLKLDAEESAERMRWLSGENWPRTIFATCLPCWDLSKGGQFTATNVWPADRSWLLYTNYDLSATRVSGSTSSVVP
jgi:hypothetical protein